MKNGTVVLRALWMGVWGVMALMLVGCQSQIGGRVYESAAWKQHGGALGKVALILAQDQVNKGVDRKSEEAAKVPVEVRMAVKSALEKLPTTTVLEDPAGLTFVADMGDREAIAAGKARGADSVCLMTVADYRGVLSIDIFPPGWACRTHIVYSARLLDVATGELLAHCVTHHVAGGWFQAVSREDALQGIKWDLRPPEPPAKAVAKAVDQ